MRMNKYKYFVTLLVSISLVISSLLVRCLAVLAVDCFACLVCGLGFKRVTARFQNYGLGTSSQDDADFYPVQEIRSIGTDRSIGRSLKSEDPLADKKGVVSPVLKVSPTIFESIS